MPLVVAEKPSKRMLHLENIITPRYPACESCCLKSLENPNCCNGARASNTKLSNTFIWATTKYLKCKIKMTKYSMALFSMFIVAISQALASAAYQCISDDDCSLNGICTSRGRCQCDPGWTSQDCNKLDLQPTTRWTGYNHTNVTLPGYYTFQNGNSSWGGQIVRDQHDESLFHLITSQFARGCGLAGWRPFSTIIRAESRTGPAGPYHYAQELFRPFHHNPAIVWSPVDEQYLLYNVGIDVNETLPTHRASYKWPNNISVSSNPDVRGPWTQPQLVAHAETSPAPWPAWSKESSQISSPSRITISFPQIGGTPPRTTWSRRCPGTPRTTATTGPRTRSCGATSAATSTSYVIG